ncbi:MAG: hypothetical protein ACP5LM_01190 [Thermoplasmata archaeon]
MKENTICDVSGCSEQAVKSLPREKVENMFSLKTNSSHIHLCKEHYKQYKKKTKKERDIERATWVK